MSPVADLTHWTHFKTGATSDKAQPGCSVCNPSFFDSAGTYRMARSKFADSQRAAALDEVASGVPRREVCKRIGISDATFFRWQKELGRPNWGKSLEKDWPALALTWRPRLFHRVDDQAAEALRREVAQVVGSVYGRPAPERSTVARDQLARLRATASAFLEAYDGLGPVARQLIHEPLESVGDGWKALRGLGPHLEEIIAGLGELAEASGESKGGANHDHRIERLVTLLAEIWRRHVGKVPTSSVNPDTGLIATPFGDFVDDVVAHFIPEMKVSEAQLREAVRHAAARTDRREGLSNTD